MDALSECHIHLQVNFFFPASSFADLTNRKCSATTVQAQPYVYDPRTIWCDSANVGSDGYYLFQHQSVAVSARLECWGGQETTSGIDIEEE
jgi:hypothetical protein